MGTQWIEIETPEAEGYQPQESVAPAAASLLWMASQHEDPTHYLSDLLPALAPAFAADYAALAAARAGQWEIGSYCGRTKPLPRDFLGEVLDRGAVGSWVDGDQIWLAGPLEPRGTSGELFVLSQGHLVASQSEILRETAEQLAAILPAFRRGLEIVREKSSKRLQVRRLEKILEIAAQWNQTREMEPLLIQMAEAATELLDADRASIFLWDRSSKTLVGRPALGVEGNELRIPDDAGIVGQVVQTGETRRVDEAEQSEINRKVDQKLGYETRTILCVPLIGSDAQIFGAFEVINKLQGNFDKQDEITLKDLAAHAAVPLENTQERQDLLETRRQMTEEAAQRVQLIGNSPAIEGLRAKISRVADSELAVLVLGENGTGKEVVSQLIHYLSQRRDHPFVAVNCAALTETLLESELFGHEKGAFTDAHESRAGKFELASGGTLFLDEIGDMSLGGQAKLLRVLEDKTVVRVGGSQPIHTDTRVVAATNQNLADMVRNKKFRQDLYYRLNVVTLDLPPLRDRGEDIMLLAEHFLQDFCKKARRRKVPKFTSEAKRRMLAHAWPGNVRELRNLMERLAYLTTEDRIESEDLAFILSPGRDDSMGIVVDQPLAVATEEFQAEYIRRAIKRVGGNMSEAAKLLGLHRSNLYRKMRQLEMAPEEGSTSSL
ncbi:Type IV fimbriae expression regulatory protein PilR [Planctomycetales bacterium 10988]|nr:Type IV fimbriae expression regulatory protein PilR [Planctomycetales bacterium 10988]